MSNDNITLNVFTDAKKGDRNYMEDVVCVKRIHVKCKRRQTSENLPALSDYETGAMTDSESDANTMDNNDDYSECEACVSADFDMGTENNETSATVDYFAVFDGHGGPEASEFAKRHLLQEIKRQNDFWSTDDECVVRAIKHGFISTHRKMWNVLSSWPKSSGGLPSTSGTTASTVIRLRNKLFVAHVGDSAVVVARKENVASDNLITSCITADHKPDAPEEKQRIESDGGQVALKAGVARIVWQRPRLYSSHRHGNGVEHIPFLAVSRSLGDLWSYNSDQDRYIVSPEPDVEVIVLDPDLHRFLIVSSDGLWNVFQPDEAINLVRSILSNKNSLKIDRDPAQALTSAALSRWRKKRLRADNISVIVVVFNPESLTSHDKATHTLSRTSTLILSDSDDNSSDLDFALPDLYPLQHHSFRRAFLAVDDSDSSKDGLSPTNELLDRPEDIFSTKDLSGKYGDLVRYKSSPFCRTSLLCKVSSENVSRLPISRSLCCMSPRRNRSSAIGDTCNSMRWNGSVKSPMKRDRLDVELDSISSVSPIKQSTVLQLLQCVKGGPHPDKSSHRVSAIGQRSTLHHCTTVLSSRRQRLRARKPRSCSRITQDCWKLAYRVFPKRQRSWDRPCQRWSGRLSCVRQVNS